jgi:hypothetical protein
MNWKILLGVVGVLAAGCSGGADGEQGPRGAPGPAGQDVVVSGDRLRARWYLGQDGARQFAGWYDEKMDLECSFALAGDGVVRCLPMSDVRADVYFKEDLESPCSEPYGWRHQSSCESAPRYALGADATACPPRTLVYVVGRRYEPDFLPNVEEQKPNGYCDAASVTYGDFFDVALATPDAFAAAEMMTD